MMIGPDRKRAKSKKRDRARKAEAATVDGAHPAASAASAVPDVGAPHAAPAVASDSSAAPADRPGAPGDAPTGLAELLMEPDDALAASADRPTALPAAERPTAGPGGVGGDPVAGLLERVARIHDRVGGLLDLTEALTVARDGSDGDDGDGPIGSGLSLAADVDRAPEPARGTPGSSGAARTSAPAAAPVLVPEPAPAPTTSATLVARELLERGMDADGVRERLRDGYGVPDPDAVLAALA